MLCVLCVFCFFFFFFTDFLPTCSSLHFMAFHLHKSLLTYWLAYLLILSLVYERGAHVTVNDLEQSFSSSTAIKIVAHAWHWIVVNSFVYDVQGGAKKRGHRPSYLIANIPKTPWPNCTKIGGLLQYYMLNTVINLLFKNVIALWRHLAKTPLLSFIHTVKIDLSITQ